MGNWKHHWLTRCCCCCGKKEKSSEMYCCMSLWLVTHLCTSSSQNFWTSSFGSVLQSVLALCFKCLPKKQTWHLLIFKTQTVHPSPFDVWLHLALPQYRTWWRAERFLPFLFQINWHSVKIVPNTQPNPASRMLFSFQHSCILHLSCQPSLSLFLLPKSDRFLMLFWIAL